MLRSQSYVATPPGATITEQLDDKGIGQKEFAVKMDMSEELAEELIQGNIKKEMHLTKYAEYYILIITEPATPLTQAQPGGTFISKIVCAEIRSKIARGRSG